MKKLLIFLYVMVIIAMAVATIVEKYHGTAFHSGQCSPL